jgi:pimeloyl-ACP methyl ester carboxylesterase
MTVAGPVEGKEIVIMNEARVLTATRVVALAIIGVLVAGLGYLGMGGEDAASVPAGAKAGDLILHDCSYPTEAGDLPADCGTLVVAENASEPGSRLIALPIVRIRARSDEPGEPIFRLQGGPGISNMPFPAASRYAVDRDFVLVGYRGVDGSERLDCPEVVSALKHSADLTGEASFQAFAAGFRACAARFADEGIDVTSYGLSQQVDDLEATREALGYERINLVSESVGTRTAMIYAWRYPERINRSVMIAANPPGNFVWDPATTDEQIARYAEYCSKDAGCRDRTADLAASMRRTSTEIPERWLFLPIKEGNVRAASHYGLMETTVESAPLHAPMTIDSWLSAAEGDAGGFWFQSLLADFAFPTAFVWGQYASAASLDAEVANEYFAPEGQPRDSNLGYAATAFGWGGGRLSEAWPAARDAGAYGEVRPSEVETLVVSGELDFAAPPQLATEQLLPSLENGQQIILPGFGHSTDYWDYQPEASSRLINTFFASGRVDDSLYRPHPVDFTPEVTLPALAKGIAGTMVGLALGMVLSLLWMAHRVRSRGSIGPKASAALRSLYPIVLGLGGWFLGLLVVLTMMPGVPLDSALLATFSIGGPIGLGIYLAWMHRDRPAPTKSTGFAAAMGGALVGAWLGFIAAGDLLALVTAIVGAAAGANLAVILFDIVESRRGDRLPESMAVVQAPARVDA